MDLGKRLSRLDDCGRGWRGIAPDLFLDTRHSSERDYDIAATLDAIRMLVESEV